jgi:hypothetical protein
MAGGGAACPRQPRLVYRRRSQGPGRALELQAAALTLSPAEHQRDPSAAAFMVRTNLGSELELSGEKPPCRSDGCSEWDWRLLDFS